MKILINFFKGRTKYISTNSETTIVPIYSSYSSNVYFFVLKNNVFYQEYHIYTKPENEFISKLICKSLTRVWYSSLTKMKVSHIWESSCKSKLTPNDIKLQLAYFYLNSFM